MKNIKVDLISATSLKVATYAGLICTASENNIEKYDDTEFLGKLIKSGHESVIEHINYSFMVDNVSRSLLQELARHRHISLSVQSTRWALKKMADDVDKMSIDIFPDKNDINYNNMNGKEQIYFETIYSKYADILNDIGNLSAQGVPNDILKYFLPEAFTTKLMLTTNARELRLIFKLRTSPRALKEFRALCRVIYDSLPNEHKFMYSEFFQ